MKTLSPPQRRTLRAKAHGLRPVVIIGHHGLTPAVMTEIDVSLRAHELIKIRVLGDDRSARGDALARICCELDAAPVQQLGKLLIVWRPQPEPEVSKPARRQGKPSTTNRPAPVPPRRAQPRRISAWPMDSGRRSTSTKRAGSAARPEGGPPSPGTPRARRRRAGA
jgi:putative YhbY family RNA-binding protein